MRPSSAPLTLTPRLAVPPTLAANPISATRSKAPLPSSSNRSSHVDSRGAVVKDGWGGRFRVHDIVEEPGVDGDRAGGCLLLVTAFSPKPMGWGIADDADLSVAPAVE
jgi:hypothetical protein